MQIIVDLNSGFKFRTKDNEWNSYNNLVIRENVIHQLDTNGSIQLIIYIDAESTLAKELKAGPMTGLEIYAPVINTLNEIDQQALQSCILNPEPNILLTIVNQVLNLLNPSSIPTKPDERISKVKELITADTNASLTVKALADKIYLSESRLRSIFKQETGIPIYKYMLWNRIRLAISLMMNGHTVQDAAFEAGFTDTSHFHKMLVQMLGISPSAFMKNNRFFNVINVDETPLKFSTNVYSKTGTLEKFFEN